MTKTTDLLVMLKLDLLITSSAYDSFLTQLLNSAQEMIAREGVTLRPDSAEDNQLIVGYAAYLFRQRSDAGIHNTVSTVWNAISATVSGILNGINSVVSSIWSVISGFISGVLNGISTTVSSIWNAIKSTVSSVLNGIRSTVQSVWSAIQSAISSAMNSISSNISNIWNNIKSAVSSAISGIKTTIQSGFDNAVSYIKGLASQAWNWGADIISGIVNGIKSKIGDIKNAVTNVADTIKSHLHFSVPDEGPLTDFPTWMPDMMKGLAEGIEKNMKYVQGAVTDLAAHMIPTVDLSQTLRQYDAGMLRLPTAVSAQSTQDGTAAQAAAGGNSFYITINVQQMSSDYDARRAAEIMAEKIDEITMDNNSRQGVWSR